MNRIDPRELGDRAMLAYWLFGELPAPGWPGRRRLVIARRVALLVLVTIAVIAFLILARWAVVLAWAAQP